jgi:hypothetical protein
MKNIIRNIILLAACLVSTAAILPVQLEAKSAKGNNLVVALVGTDVGYVEEMKYGEPGDDATALCFDLDIIDLKTGKKIGTATDCLSNITPVGDGLALVGRTFFHFPGGTVVTRGLTTVQPITHGSPDFTHITGAIPAAGENSVLAGDGKFKNVAGTARLSGAVNMLGGDEIAFNCVFVLDFEKDK